MFRNLFKLVVVSCVFMACCGIVYGAGSPIDKGSLIVGGGAAFSSMGGELYEDGNGDGVTILLLAPEVGTFVAPNVAISAQLVYGSVSFGDDKISAVGIGPRIRYYFGQPQPSGLVKGTTYPYMTASFLWGQLDVDDDDGYSLTSYSFGGGITYMMANSVGLFGEINFRNDSIKEDDYESESGSSLGIWAGFTLFIWE